MFRYYTLSRGLRVDRCTPLLCFRRRNGDGYGDGGAIPLAPFHVLHRATDRIVTEKGIGSDNDGGYGGDNVFFVNHVLFVGPLGDLFRRSVVHVKNPKLPCSATEQNSSVQYEAPACFGTACQRQLEFDKIATFIPKRVLVYHGSPFDEQMFQIIQKVQTHHTNRLDETLRFMAANPDALIQANIRISATVNVILVNYAFGVN
jgi:hypothetical protein